MSVNFKGKRSATAHSSSRSSPRAWTYKPLMGKKYGLNFSTRGAWKSCAVRISVRHLLQTLLVFYMSQDTFCNSPPLLSGTAPGALAIDWHSCSCSARKDLIKAASFVNTFRRSQRGRPRRPQRGNAVLETLSQVGADQNKRIITVSKTTTEPK